ncbi:MAG: PDZ domain-containing protein [Planctomycetota bacterium]|nr:PDZ domain-containing protein [Planctomycetota bacterium]
MSCLSLVLTLATLALPPSSETQTAAAASYLISLDEAAQHRVIVEARMTPADGVLKLWMPVWTPGSYKIRDYARHIEEIVATDAAGTVLPIERPTKNSWVIQTSPGSEVKVRYRLYARLLTVRTNFVEADSGFLNGAATFLLPRGSDGPFDITIAIPETMASVVTSLPVVGVNQWRAENIDQLCDSPIIFGSPRVENFEIDTVPHYLVNLGGEDLWDDEACAADVKLIAEEMAKFWGHIPYSDYRYLNVIAEGGGGLEHLNCTLMLTGRWTWGDEDRRKGWFGLVSHEHFHAWNGKRLRPEALGPFDYEQEVFTPDLWFVEGFTSYYDDLLIARAGLLDQKEYLERLGKQIDGVQKTPGRLVLPLSRASTDAWIRYYQRDENSVNSQISYYTKGAIVAWLLDARIRAASDHQKTLDDAMRLAYSRYSGERGYSHDQLYAVFEEIAGVELDDWFERFIDGTDELEYGEALEVFGLRFPPEQAEDENEDEEDEDPVPGWLGIDASESNGRWMVTRVRRGTPAYQVGLNTGDELLALNNYRVNSGNWKTICLQHPPGTRARLLISRRGVLTRLEVEFGKKPEQQWKLQLHPDATEDQAIRRAAWLGRAGAEAHQKEQEKAREKAGENAQTD